MNELNILQNFTSLNPALLLLILAWSTAWKGVALWKSAQKKQLYWFIALLVLNTVGILEILYIFVFSEMKKKEKIQEQQ